MEKGIDVRIALDLVRLFFEDQYDAAVIFSQDQDLMEATEEVKQISRREGRPVELFSAYPVGPGTMNKRGINKTTWIQLDHDTYHRCIDQRDYRYLRPKAIAVETEFHTVADQAFANRFENLAPRPSSRAHSFRSPRTRGRWSRSAHRNEALLAA